MICVMAWPCWMKNSPYARPYPALGGRKPHTAAPTAHRVGTGSSCTRFLRDVKLVRNTQLKLGRWIGVTPVAISIPSFHRTPPLRMR